MRCRICGNEGDHREYEAREMMYGYRDTFRYFQCAQCRCLQIADIPPDLSKYYAEDYYSFQSIREPNGVKSYPVALRDRYAIFGTGTVGRLSSWLYPTPAFTFLHYVPFSRFSHILDVGCGAGKRLYALRKAGFENLLGIDPFLAGDIEYRNGLMIRKQGIEEVQGKWDIITFHHSFEHIPEPGTTLRSAHRLLNPGGHCIVAVPTVSSYAWERYGTNWVQLDAPRHLYLYSLESMEILARGTGFELSRVVYNSTGFQFWGSEQYLMGVPLRDGVFPQKGPPRAIFSKEDLRQFERRAGQLNASNRGDQALFYLRRVENPAAG